MPDKKPEVLKRSSGFLLNRVRELCVDGCRFCVCVHFEEKPVHFLPENIDFATFFFVLAQVRYSPLDHLESHGIQWNLTEIDGIRRNLV